MLSGKVVIEERRTKLNGPKDFDVANVDQLEGKVEQSGSQEKKGNSRKERTEKCTFRCSVSHKSWNSPKSAAEKFAFLIQEKRCTV
ncbi:Protein CBG24825 [Caenorhabditis briggsae]|uniref:Protein CBG24825 n=1 Tax=Caenorhabditis briggsae TaxID=6238 RepID=A8WLK7_CAEBR|nr:Protein CBG24825 [Caenorhabditis briggsae]CAP21352.1 Protein CBG24825 [Caenorhabditis briggsae]